MNDLNREKGRAWVEVDLDAVRANVAALHALSAQDTQLMAVVKADAYGHGLVPVARAALNAGATWAGVAATAEGVALRNAGIEAPILLLCALPPGEVEVALAYRLTPTIGDEADLRSLVRAAAGRTVEAHLEVDTGIGRAGARPDGAVSLWQRATDADLRMTGVMTHFADADGTDPALTLAQRELFASVRQALHRAGARFEWVHSDNSASVAGRIDPDDPPCGNLLRPGLLLYGVRPPNDVSQSQPAAAARSGIGTPPSFLLPPFALPAFSLPPPASLIRPALALYARVASVRALPEGHPISYGATHRLVRDSRVATVLIGYGDGYPRRLSNIGHMLLHGQRAPILGRVCMDQTVVDVTDIPDAEPGDVAVCIGAQEGNAITAESLALAIGTTEHEITTCLTARLPRLYIGA